MYSANPDTVRLNSEVSTFQRLLSIIHECRIMMDERLLFIEVFLFQGYPYRGILASFPAPLPNCEKWERARGLGYFIM